MDFRTTPAVGRRAFLALAALAIGGAALDGATASAQETMRVGVQSVPPDEVYLARDWTEPYGLDAEITQFSSGGEMVKAFVADRVDVANGGSARLVTLAAQQPDSFYIIAAHQYGGDRYGVIVPADSDVQSIEDLKGKKIGAVTGSGTYNTFRMFLDHKGLSENDFEVVNMKVDDLRAAVENGIIDAAVAWEPHVAIAETMGGVRRLVSMKGVNQSPNFILVSRDFADQNPESVVKFLASEIDSGNLIKENPQEAGKIAAEEIASRGVEVDPKALELAFKRINVDREVTDELISELTPIAESMKEAGKVDDIPDFSSFVRKDFYEKAKELSASK